MNTRANGPRAALPALVVVLLASGGCTSPAPRSTATGAATASPTVATDATTLQGLGLRHGPGDVTLPRGTRLTSAIDQPNVVTLTMPVDQGGPVQEWLVERHPAGWTVAGARGASVVLRTVDGRPEPWEAGLACSRATCALTFRQQ